MKARYTIATVTTHDEKIVIEAKRIREHGYRHEDIYVAGLLQIGETLKNTDNTN